MPDKITETQMCEDLRATLESKGGEVYSEVEVYRGRVDLVWVVPEGHRIAIECKIRDGMKCIAQAKQRITWFDQTFSVLPEPANDTIKEYLKRVAAMARVGLWWWAPGQFYPAVECEMRRPGEGNEFKVTEALMDSRAMKQSPGVKSPRGSTLAFQIVIEAEAWVREQGGELLLKDVGSAINRRFGLTPKQVRAIVSEQIAKGHGGDMVLDKSGPLHVVRIDEN